MATTRSTEEAPFVADDRSIDFYYISESQDWAAPHPEISEVPRNIALPHPTALLCFIITFTVDIDLSLQGLVAAVKDEGIRAADRYMSRKDPSESFILFALREILKGCGASVKEELKRMNTDSNPLPYIRTCAMLLLWIIEGVNEVKLNSYLGDASSYDLQSLFLVREFAAVRELWDGRCLEAADWTLGMLQLIPRSKPPAEKKLFVRMASGYCSAYLNRGEEAKRAWEEANAALESCCALPESWLQVLADSQRADNSLNA